MSKDKSEDKPKSKPEAKARPTVDDVAPKHDGEKILLVHEALGPYSCTTLEKIDGLTNTNQERYRNHQMVLMPGLNLVAKSLWALVSTNRRLADKVDAGEIYIVDNFAKVRLNKAQKMVRDSADVPTLEALLKTEKREGVIEVLVDHIAECKDSSGRAGAARRAQRAHHRRTN